MVRKRITPQLASSIIHDILDAQNRFFLDPRTNQFVVSRDDANEIMHSIAQLALDHKITGDLKNWSGRYMIQIYQQSEHVRPIPHAVANALMIYAQLMDDVPEVRVGKEPITTYANPGMVKPNTVILTSSRKCANPTCPVHFIPKIHNQKYCHHTCRNEHYANKQSRNGSHE